MTLAKSFIKIAPRESSGSTTSNAYDFQKDWALCFLLQCHDSLNDYLIILDYHDDIVLFDSEKKPKNADFYQVKTKKMPPWKINHLITTKAGQANSLSIIGKMYENKLKFKGKTRSLNFISNSYFDFILESKTTDCKSKAAVCVSELDKTSIAKLTNAIKKDHGLKKKPNFGKITFFRVTDMSIDGHNTHALGELTKFLDKMFPSQKYTVLPLYRTLFGEISRKTNYAKKLSTMDDDLHKKSIGKKYLDSILSGIAVKKDFTEVWKEIEPHLIKESYGVVPTKYLKQCWDRVEIDLIDHSNSTLQRLYSLIKSIVSDVIKDKTLTLTLIMQHSVDDLKQNHGVPSYVDDDYIKALVLAAFYE